MNGTIRNILMIAFLDLTVNNISFFDFSGFQQGLLFTALVFISFATGLYKNNAA